ncbi:MAG: iron chelate uptake ABC transporter family permease subunit [Pseudomonadota bacterium]
MLDKRIWMLAFLLLLSCFLYLTLETRGQWQFALSYRSPKLLALIVVACAVSTSTLLFQTITHNRILTPSIMGFDALYILVVTLAVYFLGTIAFVAVGEFARFFITLITLTIIALALFSTLLGGEDRDLFRMILTGVILGTLFRSLSSLITRLIDPNEYSIIQVNSYARFEQINLELVWLTALISAAALLRCWQLRSALDVLALGRVAAVNLGESIRRRELEVLTLITILVAASTALVGPVAFLGLLVVNLTYLIMPGIGHHRLMPCAALVGCIVLVGGQMVVERVLKLSTPLTVIIDLLGGLLFLALLLSRKFK